jgi:hypothetical protein
MGILQPLAALCRQKTQSAGQIDEVANLPDGSERNVQEPIELGFSLSSASLDNIRGNRHRASSHLTRESIPFRSGHRLSFPINGFNKAVGKLKHHELSMIPHVPTVPPAIKQGRLLRELKTHPQVNHGQTNSSQR